LPFAPFRFSHARVHLRYFVHARHPSVRPQKRLFFRRHHTLVIFSFAAAYFSFHISPPAERAFGFLSRPPSSSARWLLTFNRHADCPASRAAAARQANFYFCRAVRILPPLTGWLSAPPPENQWRITSFSIIFAAPR